LQAVGGSIETAGAAARAIDLLDEQQRLNEIPDRNQRYQRIAQDYVRGHEAGQQTLFPACGHRVRAPRLP
jgi:hypothetical protein